MFTLTNLTHESVTLLARGLRRVVDEARVDLDNWTKIADSKLDAKGIAVFQHAKAQRRFELAKTILHQLQPALSAYEGNDVTLAISDHQHVPVEEILSDGSKVYNCACGYAFENEREALTGEAYAPGTRGAQMENVK